MAKEMRKETCDLDLSQRETVRMAQLYMETTLSHKDAQTVVVEKVEWVNKDMARVFYRLAADRKAE